MSRPPETWVDQNGPAPVYVALIDVLPSQASARPVVHLPRPGRDCVAWLEGGSAADALVELAEPGRIRLLPWQPFGDRLVERRRELSQNPEESQIEELIFLTERYRRVHIDKGGRFPLHDRELFHLGLGSS